MFRYDNVHRTGGWNWETDGDHIYLVSVVVRKVALRMNVSEAEDRVWSLYKDYMQAWKANWFEWASDNKLHVAIDHIKFRRRPHQLKASMLNIVHSREDNNFHLKNLQCVHDRAKKQAKTLHREKWILLAQKSQVLAIIALESMNWGFQMFPGTSGKTKKNCRCKNM